MTGRIDDQIYNVTNCSMYVAYGWMDGKWVDVSVCVMRSPKTTLLLQDSRSCVQQSGNIITSGLALCGLHK